MSHSRVCSRMTHDRSRMLVGSCKLIKGLINQEIKESLAKIKVWYLFSQPLNPFNHLCKIIISLPSFIICDNDLRASLTRVCQKE